MALKRITMQQLADACGLSRNTVSKIFNGRGAVPELTKQAVLQKAKELGYHYGLDEEPAKADAQRLQAIALLTRRIPVDADAHFGTFFLPTFAERLSRAGYTLMMYEISPEDFRIGKLPSHLPLEQTAGISTIEMFDRKYLNMLCAQGLPCISIDACARAYTTPMKCDFISMENISSTAVLTNHVIAAGAKRLGFIGDPEHCDSFHQRWMGFLAALADAGMTVDKPLCILDPDSPDYSNEDWLFMRIQGMSEKPDALICANDFIALRVMTVLKRMGLSIPDDVMVAGFDGSPQSAAVEPSLTTVQIPSVDIAQLAADMLLKRIQNPDQPFRRVYVKTTPVWRNSTARK